MFNSGPFTRMSPPMKLASEVPVPLLLLPLPLLDTPLAVEDTLLSLPAYTGNDEAECLTVSLALKVPTVLVSLVAGAVASILGLRNGGEATSAIPEIDFCDLPAARLARIALVRLTSCASSNSS